MSKKYALTNNLNLEGQRQIIALRSIRNEYTKVSPGDLGGFISYESCLSQDGECWVDKNSTVTSGRVLNDAYVRNSMIQGIVKDNAAVLGYDQQSQVLNSSIVGGKTRIVDSEIQYSNISGVHVIRNSKIYRTDLDSAESVYISESSVRRTKIVGECINIDYSRLFECELEGMNIHIDNAIRLNHVRVVNKFEDDRFLRINNIVSMRDGLIDGNNQYMSVNFAGWEYPACIHKGIDGLLITVGCQTVPATVDSLKVISQRENLKVTERDIKLFKLIVEDYLS